MQSFNIETEENLQCGITTGGGLLKGGSNSGALGQKRASAGIAALIESMPMYEFTPNLIKGNSKTEAAPVAKVQKTGTSLRTQKIGGRKSIMKVTGKLSPTGKSMPRKTARQTASMYKLGLEQGRGKTPKARPRKAPKVKTSLRTQKTKGQKSIIKVTGNLSPTGKSMPRKTARQAASMYKLGLEQGRRTETSLRTQKTRGQKSIMKVTGKLSPTGTSLPRKTARQVTSMYKLGVEQGQNKPSKAPVAEAQKTGTSLRTQETRGRKSIMKVTGNLSSTGKSMSRKTARQVASIYKLGVEQGRNKSKPKKD